MGRQYVEKALMKPDTYKILQMAIEDGVTLGVRRAFKYVEQPDEEALIETVQQEVMNQVCEWFRFDNKGYFN